MCSVFLFLSFHSSLELLILSMCAVFVSLIALLCFAVYSKYIHIES